jgi:prevent-host-death family protein
MKRVGVYEAKTKLPQLLDEVARGRRVTITRHGTPVALLVPAGAHGTKPVGDVIAALLAFGRGRRLGRLSLRTLIEQGRR